MKCECCVFVTKKIIHEYIKNLVYIHTTPNSFSECHQTLPLKRDNMKASKSNALTMLQIKGYKKTSKGKHKQYWQDRIDALAGEPAYQKWLKKNK